MTCGALPEAMTTHNMACSNNNGEVNNLHVWSITAIFVDRHYYGGNFEYRKSHTYHDNVALMALHKWVIDVIISLQVWQHNPVERFPFTFSPDIAFGSAKNRKKCWNIDGTILSAKPIAEVYIVNKCHWLLCLEYRRIFQFIRNNWTWIKPRAVWHLLLHRNRYHKRAGAINVFHVVSSFVLVSDVPPDYRNRAPNNGQRLISQSKGRRWAVYCVRYNMELAPPPSPPHEIRHIARDWINFHFGISFNSRHRLNNIKAHDIKILANTPEIVLRQPFMHVTSPRDHECYAYVCLSYDTW